MYFRQNLYLIIVVFFGVLLPTIAYSQSKVLVFDQLGNNQPHQEATKLIKTAYEQLGISLEYKKMPLSRSYREANLGRLDGLQGRVAEQTIHFPNLIKVNVPIIDFKVTIVADKLQCGDCELYNINKAATVNGYAALKLYLQDNNLPMHIDFVENRQTVQRLFDRRRVQAMILSDVLLGHHYFEDTKRWRIFYLCKVQTFHYLNQKHHELVQPITNELNKLLSTTNGTSNGNEFYQIDFSALGKMRVTDQEIKDC